jgi:hypothetical protein
MALLDRAGAEFLGTTRDWLGVSQDFSCFQSSDTRSSWTATPTTWVDGYSAVHVQWQFKSLSLGTRKTPNKYASTPYFSQGLFKGHSNGLS